MIITRHDVSIEIQHEKGQPIGPQAIQRNLGKPGFDVFVYLRLAQDPRRVYRGKVRWLEPPTPDWQAWRIGTQLAFHADDTRVSFIDERKGHDDGRDEVIAIVIVPEGREPEPASISFTELCEGFTEE